MANLMPETVLELHVGDKKRLSYQFLKASRVEVQPLTGHAAWATFAYVGVAPHVERAALVDEANGIVIYDMLGDELPTDGTVELYYTVCPPDWYVAGAAARSYIRTSTPIIKIVVRRRPT